MRNILVPSITLTFALSLPFTIPLVAPASTNPGYLLVEPFWKLDLVQEPLIVGDPDEDGQLEVLAQNSTHIQLYEEPQTKPAWITELLPDEAFIGYFGTSESTLAFAMALSYQIRLLNFSNGKELGHRFEADSFSPKGVGGPVGSFLSESETGSTLLIVQNGTIRGQNLDGTVKWTTTIYSKGNSQSTIVRTDPEFNTAIIYTRELATDDNDNLITLMDHENGNILWQKADLIPWKPSTKNIVADLNKDDWIDLICRLDSETANHTIVINGKDGSELVRFQDHFFDWKLRDLDSDRASDILWVPWKGKSSKLNAYSVMKNKTLWEVDHLDLRYEYPENNPSSEDNEAYEFKFGVGDFDILDSGVEVLIVVKECGSLDPYASFRQHMLHGKTGQKNGGQTGYGSFDACVGAVGLAETGDFNDDGRCDYLTDISATKGKFILRDGTTEFEIAEIFLPGLKIDSLTIISSAKRHSEDFPILYLWNIEDYGAISFYSFANIEAPGTLHTEQSAGLSLQHINVWLLIVLIISLNRIKRRSLDVKAKITRCRCFLNEKRNHREINI